MTDTATTQTQTPEPSPQKQPIEWRAVFQDILSGGPLRVFLAIVLAFVIGSLLVIFTNEKVLHALGNDPAGFLSAAGNSVTAFFDALLRGSIYNYRGDTFVQQIRPLTESLRNAGPLIAAGLGVALTFRVGMFNIGGQGQIIVGASFAAYAGFAFELPPIIHMAVAVLFGMAGAAIWAAIVGFLKAQTGAHEVILTIMMNYIALNLATFFMKTDILNPGAANQNPQTKPILETAVLPPLFGSSFNLTIRFVLSLLAVGVYWWLMEKSSIGYRLKAVGFNPDAARTSGIDVKRVYVLAMVFSGVFVGVAAANLALARVGSISPTVDNGIGFDAITVALLGGGNAIGVLLAGLLFGAMKAAGPAMQSGGISADIVSVVQGLIILFVAAPPLIRAIFRLPKSKEGSQ